MRWKGVLVGILAAVGPASLVQPAERTFDVDALWSLGVAYGVCRSSSSGAIELSAGELIEDDGPAAGYSYKPQEEKLGDTVRIKKILVLDSPQARSATLLVAPGGDLQAEVNGRAVELPPPRRVSNYWQAYNIPPKTLRKGVNEIVLFGDGKLWIARDDEYAAGSLTRTEHPNRSFKSINNGATWNDRQLGTKGNIDGEYYVRLVLDRYNARGSLRLPVVDVANLGQDVVSPPLKSINRVEIAATSTQPRGTGISLRLRTGDTPEAEAEGWSPWRQVPPSGVVTDLAGRYLQVAVDLRADDRLRSPTLRSVTIKTDAQIAADWTAQLEVGKVQNATIVRSSIPFTYEPFDHPALAELRRRHRLDEVVSGAESELEIIGRLAGWSARLWTRGHLGEVYPDWSTKAILAPHKDGTPVGGFCQQYNVAFLQACESFGIPGRAVSMGPGEHGATIRSGHEVVELWSNQFEKWIYVDGNYAWMLRDKETQVPLSLWEIRQRQIAALRNQRHPAVELHRFTETDHVWKGLAEKPPFFELRLIPRSDFLQRKAPLPLNQGMRGWFWTGHYVWTDDAYPASILYGRRVCQENNWRWTLNQAEFWLEATDSPGELRVHLVTQTPGLESFVARRDDGQPRDIVSGFRWELTPGPNRLEVWPRNRAGRRGISSCVHINWVEVE